MKNETSIKTISDCQSEARILRGLLLAIETIEYDESRTDERIALVTIAGDRASYLADDLAHLDMLEPKSHDKEFAGTGSHPANSPIPPTISVEAVFAAAALVLSKSEMQHIFIRIKDLSDLGGVE